MLVPPFPFNQGCCWWLDLQCTHFQEGVLVVDSVCSARQDAFVVWASLQGCDQEGCLLVTCLCLCCWDWHCI
jgi:hypothetical protein